MMLLKQIALVGSVAAFIFIGKSFWSAHKYFPKLDELEHKEFIVDKYSHTRTNERDIKGHSYLVETFEMYMKGSLTQFHIDDRNSNGQTIWANKMEEALWKSRVLNIWYVQEKGGGEPSAPERIDGKNVFQMEIGKQSIFTIAEWEKEKGRHEKYLLKVGLILGLICCPLLLISFLNREE